MRVGLVFSYSLLKEGNDANKSEAQLNCVQCTQRKYGYRRVEKERKIEASGNQDHEQRRNADEEKVRSSRSAHAELVKRIVKTLADRVKKRPRHSLQCRCRCRRRDMAGIRVCNLALGRRGVKVARKIAWPRHQCRRRAFLRLRHRRTSTQVFRQRVARKASAPCPRCNDHHRG